MIEILRRKFHKEKRSSIFPMDFLKTFAYDGRASGRGGGGFGYSLKEETLEEENVELSLGLSLNGRFGVERRFVVVNSNYGNDNRLIRSSSVADFSSFPSGTEDPTPLSEYLPLTRTCSLPIETEECKKRKELQSLRRSEAKRKRVEKLKNGRVVKGSTTEENCETKRRSFSKGIESSPPSLLPPLPRPPPPPFPSIGSPASGGSSEVSDLESQQSVSHQILSSSSHRSNPIASEYFSAAWSPMVDQNDETLKMMFANMPCVSTKGDGVNGKKIEGFLYRYKKGEEVRIICVCHGSFLTPAEFVKHGGGGDVENPLRHIVVSPPSL